MTCTHCLEKRKGLLASYFRHKQIFRSLSQCALKSSYMSIPPFPSAVNESWSYRISWMRKFQSRVSSSETIFACAGMKSEHALSDDVLPEAVPPGKYQALIVFYAEPEICKLFCRKCMPVYKVNRCDRNLVELPYGKCGAAGGY